MKVRVVIEEIISQSFEIEVDENVDDVYEEVRKKYKNGELVVDNPTLTDASFQLIDEENDEYSSWVGLDI